MKFLATLVAALILLQGCAGPMAKTAGPAPVAPAREAGTGPDTNTTPADTETAKHRVWPWIVGGAAVAAVALVAFVYIAAEGAAKAAGQAAANSGGNAGRSNGPITVADSR